MSRSISIGYTKNSLEVDLDVGYRKLLGSQSPSMKFWSLPILTELGLKGLTELGHLDPVDFVNWEGLSILEKEIKILEDNISNINFDTVLLNNWVENLRYSLEILKKYTPKDSIPFFSIG